MSEPKPKKRNGTAKPTVDASDKPKRERKKSPTTFAGQLRELASKHRSKLSKLTNAEAKLERKLASVRPQREAAEGPLRMVEEMIADRPELPGLESKPGELVDNDPLGIGQGEPEAPAEEAAAAQ